MMDFKLKDNFIDILEGLSEDEMSDLLYLEKLAVDYFNSNYQYETSTSEYDLSWYFVAVEMLYNGKLYF